MHKKKFNQEKFDFEFDYYTCNWVTAIILLNNTTCELNIIVFGFFNQITINIVTLLNYQTKCIRNNFNPEFEKQYPNCINYPQNSIFFSIKEAENFYFLNKTFSLIIQTKFIYNL